MFTDKIAPRTVKCDSEGCDSTMTERIYGEGFIGWHHVLWLQKDGKDVLICPKCVEKISNFIKGIKKEL